MTARIHVVDSGGTTRLVKAGRFFVVDSGGTTRRVKRAFVIDSGGTARLVYTAGSTHVITNGSAGPDSGGTYYYGYSDGAGILGAELASFGSIDVATFSDGGSTTRTIRAAAQTSAASDFSTSRGYILDLAGTSIPNTDTTFAQITVNGETLLRSSATYVSDSGVGTTYWLWSLTGNFYPNGTHTLEIGF